MSLPKIAGRDEWLAARKELLAKEKDLTRQRDALNTERRNLPMVEIEKDYIFDGPKGPVRLIDLFEGRPQLIIYHFMFDPEWEDGLPELHRRHRRAVTGFLEHLHTRDTSYAMVSRAPLAKLERWKAKQGWDLPWYSSFGTDFNYDFGVTIDESVAPREYNFRTKAEFEAMGSDFFASDQPFEMPGRSCFLAGRRPRVPHVLAVRPRPRVHRRLVLLPRPHRARPSGGVGGARRAAASRPGRPCPTSRRDGLRLSQGAAQPSASRSGNQLAELLRCQDAVALGEQLGDLVPVDAERRAPCPPRPHATRARRRGCCAPPEGVEVRARRPEGEDGHRAIRRGNSR